MDNAIAFRNAKENARVQMIAVAAVVATTTAKAAAKAWFAATATTIIIAAKAAAPALVVPQPAMNAVPVAALAGNAWVRPNPMAFAVRGASVVLVHAALGVGMVPPAKPVRLWGPAENLETNAIRVAAPRIAPFPYVLLEPVAVHMRWLERVARPASVMPSGNAVLAAFLGPNVN